MRKPTEELRRTISIRLHPKTIAWLEKHLEPRTRGKFIESVLSRCEMAKSRGFPDVA